ncbi:hypothetical protein STCU_03653 [Strigomonas culicis]|uniref:Uncharacterized protein n=1 Tax=Strigomonas culicis TaxID=28005 RepID=S9W598_9TRYP|nr:hypothetical protein STCU_03653 [Strigomonas culicis]|eukprot:EPY31050.1 hypothetical protein STCU_03653 [Strigomonas culicis]
MDPVASARNRRHNRRKRTMDAILRRRAARRLKLRDMGPAADRRTFVYKKTQERAYEEEYGHKPPSATDHAMKYIPFPPDLHLHRLIPLHPLEDEGDGGRDTRHGLHRCHVLPDDPWPERAITTANPVWTKRMHAADQERRKGKGYTEHEDRLYNPRAGCDPSSELLDAMDELAYWEEHLLTFLREAPLPLRRTLPYLHEYYRFAVHRTVRAEKRYMRCRDAVVVARKASTDLFRRSELPVERVRSFYGEAHRSLASPNYDPLRMKKSALAPLMKMTVEEFGQWKADRKAEREALLAELTV